MKEIKTQRDFLEVTMTEKDYLKEIEKLKKQHSKEMRQFKGRVVEEIKQQYEESYKQIEKELYDESNQYQEGFIAGQEAARAEMRAALGFFE